MDSNLIFLKNFCADFLQCQKNTGLYPRNHPRVEATLNELRESLAERYQEQGAPFTLETADVEDLGNREDPPGNRIYLNLSRLLKLHIIEKVTILPDSTCDELFELCCLLQEDFLRFSTKTNEELFDPSLWKFIRLSFYKAGDFPEHYLGGSVLLKRAAGLHEAGDLEQLLRRLPESAAKQVREVLSDAAFLRKISNLRRDLNRRMPVQSRGPKRQVDLIGATIADALKVEVSAPSDPDVGEKILAALESAMDFVESNMESLAAEFESATDDDPAQILTRQIQESRAIDDRIDEQVNAFQVEKARLTELFASPHENEFDDESELDDDGFDLDSILPEMTASDSRRDDFSGRVLNLNRNRDESETRESESWEEAETWENETRENETREQPNAPPRVLNMERGEPIEKIFRGITCDARQLRKELEEHDPAPQLLSVTLELLSEPAYQESIGRRWKSILKTLTRSQSDEFSLRDILDQTVQYSSAREIHGTDELIVSVLEHADSAEEAHRLFSAAVLTQADERLAASCLDRMTHQHPRQTLKLLADLNRESGPLRIHAESCLLDLAENVGLLESWAREDPEGLLQMRTFERVVDRQPQVLEAFRKFFSQAPAKQALRVIESIDKDTVSVECILLPALQNGSVETRDAAIEFLRKNPLPVVIGPLIQTVRLNNYRKQLRLDEAKGALEALAQFDDPRAKNFLEEVRTMRKHFRFEYRKEIREALEEILV